MALSKKAGGVVAAFLTASLLVVTGCVQEPTTSAQTVQEEKPASAASMADFIAVMRMILGNWVNPSNVSMYIDPDNGDTSYVASRYTEPQNGRNDTHGEGLAFKKSLLEEYRARVLAGENGFADPNQHFNQPIVASKTSHTRWNASDNDVKALTEVHQIKVYFEVGGGSKMKPNWATAAREAMTKWNNIPNTQVSFIETSSATDNDIRLRCALDGYGNGVITWLTPDPWVEKDSVEIFFNLGYESTVPHNQKVAFAMIGFANVLNITHVGTEGGTWETGTFLHIPGTPYYDPASIFQPSVKGDVIAQFSESDMKAIQQLYPVWAGLAKNSSNQLIGTGWEGPTTIATDVNSFQYEGDTLYYLKTNGSLWRKLGATATATQLWPSGSYSGFLVSFNVSRGFIAVQKDGGALYTRKPTTTTWALQSGPQSGVPEYKLWGERLVTFYPANGTLYSRYLNAASPSWYADWVGNVQSYAISGSRMAVVDNGNLFVNDGAGWNYIWDGASGGPAVKVLLSEADRMVIFTAPGWGPYYATYIRTGTWGSWELYGIPGTLYGTDLCGDKFAVINYYGPLYIYDATGGLSYGHGSIPGQETTSTVRLSGPECDYVTRIDNYGNLWAKYSHSLSPNYLYYGSNFVSLQQRPNNLR
jgi:hypothetical protein